MYPPGGPMVRANEPKPSIGVRSCFFVLNYRCYYWSLLGHGDFPTFPRRRPNDCLACGNFQPDRNRNFSLIVTEMNRPGGQIGRAKYKSCTTAHSCLDILLKTTRTMCTKLGGRRIGRTTKLLSTNLGTKAKPQQIVTQGYSHAYSTSFLS
jgi:hypothetical protein